MGVGAMFLFVLFVLVSAKKRGDVIDLEPVEFVVVGSGSGGAAVAKRLSESFSVVLIEAGGSDADHHRAISAPDDFTVWGPGSALDWNFETIQNSGLIDKKGNPRADTWPRGRVWGGCTSINAMMYVRGQTGDYDYWNSTFDSDNQIPWDYESVLPFFVDAERNLISGLNSSQYHGVNGEQAVSYGSHVYSVVADFAETYASVLGIPKNDDYNAPPRQEYAGPTQLTQIEGRRFSVSDAFLKPALLKGVGPNGEGLDLRSNCVVAKVLISGTTAYGVEYTCQNNNNCVYTQNATKEVILSAGAINTPKILMLSGIGDANALSALNIPVVVNLPGVGQNLRDHLTFPIAIYTNRTTGVSQPRRSNSISSVVFHRSGFFDDADIQVAIQAAKWFPLPGERNSDILTIGPAFNKPNSVGNVSLASSLYEDPPVISPNYLDPFTADLNVMVTALEKAQSVIAKFPDALGVASFGDQFPWGNCTTQKQREMYVRMNSKTDFHPCCTAKMGSSSDPMAVVDSSLRVFGIQNLRVVDASVMPRLTSGNLNAPTIMIGVRAARLIAQLYRK